MVPYSKSGCISPLHCYIFCRAHSGKFTIGVYREAAEILGGFLSNLHIYCQFTDIEPMQMSSNLVHSFPNNNQKSGDGSENGVRSL